MPDPDPAVPAVPDPTITYQWQPTYDAVTRQDGSGTPITIAAGMKSFPEIVFYAADGTTRGTFQEAIQARVKVVFLPRFQTPLTPSSNAIVLHGLTYLRNHDLQKQ